MRLGRTLAVIDDLRRRRVYLCDICCLRIVMYGPEYKFSRFSGHKGEMFPQRGGWIEGYKITGRGCLEMFRSRYQLKRVHVPQIQFCLCAISNGNQSRTTS